MTEYQASLQRLFSSGSSPKLGLERMRDLMRLLGNPELDVAFLHVAGTNGKGSTCAYLDAMLGAAGIRRGLYTSPHLLCARERIVINGELISEDEFVALEREVYTAAQALDEMPTFFELITAMALLAFQRQRVQVAVLEVGLGGRLDATNIVTPLICGITRIDMDHTHILGDTLAQIAGEKAGIAKVGVPLIVDEQEASAKQAIGERARSVGADVFEVGQDIQIDLSLEGIEVRWGDKCILPRAKPSLLGKHQLHNAALAVGMIEQSGLIIDLAVRHRGIEAARWPGRYELIHHDPMVIVDGAHNPAGIECLIETLHNDDRLRSKPFALVSAMTSGHSHDQMARLWKTTLCIPQIVFATCSKAPRSLSAVETARVFEEAGHKQVHMLEDSRVALEQAMHFAKECNGFVLVAGSLYLVGEVRSHLIEMPKDEHLPLY